MTKQKTTDNNKWGLWALIAGLFAIPIGIWKSSKIGKLVFIVGVVLIVFGMGAWGVGKFSDVYYNKIKYRSVIDSKLDPIKKEIDILDKDVKATIDRLGSINRDMETIYNNRVEQETRKYADILKDKYKDIMDKFEEVEKALDIIKENERKEIKSRIIYLKEDVIVHKKSIESAKIRLRCEEIADKLYLLTESEQSRFYEDLKDIGFKINGMRDNTIRIYTRTYSVETSPSIAFVYRGSE